MIPLYERVQAQIDLDAVRENLARLRANVPEGTKVCSVVKADAYGHGAVQTAQAVEDIADSFAVATPEEGLALRRHGITKPVMILGFSQHSAFPALIEYGIWPVFYQEKDAQAFSDAAQRAGQTAGCQIKLDCGMGRIGFLPGPESVETIARISRLPGLCIEGVFTHFSRADEADKELVRRQLETFLSMRAALREAGVDPALWHCDNSAGIIDLPQAGLSMVRAGIAQYGLYPSDEVDKSRVALTPALSLTSRIVFLKELPAGSGVSYNATFVTERATRVATVPVGYGDGWPRALSNRGTVLVRGRRAPVIGRVCMDQFMIDVTDIPDARDGDVVTLIGRDGAEEITADDAAAAAGTISYEIVTQLGRRVPRVFVRAGKAVATSDGFSD